MNLRKDLSSLRTFVGRIRTNPTGLFFFRHLPYFTTWRNFLENGRSPLADEIPWITFDTQAKLRSILKSDFKVFEFGAGGSSVFFSKYVKEVSTVEHDEGWFKLVEAKMRSLGRTNWTGRFEPPDPKGITSTDFADPDLYLSGDVSYKGMSFEKYASTIDKYSNDHFDLVMVDGRARPACIKKAVVKVRKGGFLVIDNSERDYYLQKVDLRAGGFHVFFNDFGPGPYNADFWQTTIWQKR